MGHWVYHRYKTVTLRESRLFVCPKCGAAHKLEGEIEVGPGLSEMSVSPSVEELGTRGRKTLDRSFFWRGRRCSKCNFAHPDAIDGASRFACGALFWLALPFVFTSIIFMGWGAIATQREPGEMAFVATLCLLSFMIVVAYYRLRCWEPNHPGILSIYSKTEESPLSQLSYRIGFLWLFFPLFAFILAAVSLILPPIVLLLVS